MIPEETLAVHETALADRADAVVLADEDTPGKMPLPVLIVYEDVAAAERAMQVIARLEGCTDGQIEFVPKVWRFDLLNDPDFAWAALEDALDADLVILATHITDTLPPAVRRWLASYRARRTRMKSALLLLYGASGAWNISLQNELGLHTARQM